MKKTALAFLLFLLAPYTLAMSIASLSEDESIDIIKKKTIDDLKKANWYSVYTTDKHDIMLNANTIFVFQTLSKVAVFVRHIPILDAEKGILNNFDEYAEMHNCSNSTMQPFSYSEYKGGELYETREWHYPWKSIKAGSTEEQIHKEACKYLKLF